MNGTAQEIVILAPTGNTGSALAQLCVKGNVSFRTGNRQDFDYYKPETYRPLLRGASDLFLVTPVVESMVEITDVLVKEAREAGIQKIVKVSAYGATPNSPARILRWHALAEEILSKSGIQSTSLRPNAFMQNLIQYYGRAIQENSVIAVPAKDARISFIDASDIAQAAFTILTSPNRFPAKIDLTGPESIGFAEVASRLSAGLGREIRYLDIPECKVREKLATAGMPSWRIEALLELYVTYRAGDAAAVDYNFQQITGLLPSSLDDFIQNNKRSWS